MLSDKHHAVFASGRFCGKALLQINTHQTMSSDALNGNPQTDAAGINLHRPMLSALEGLTPLGSASLYEDEILAIIDHIPLFGDLNRTEISELCSKMECFGAKRGDLITTEDDDGDFLGILLTGEVAIFKRGSGAENKLLSVVGPGASLGEMSLIDGQPRFATCVAREPTDIAVLTRDTIYDILVLQPSLGSKLLLLLLHINLQRLRETSDRLLPFIGGSGT